MSTVNAPQLLRFDGAPIVETICELAVYLKCKGASRDVVFVGGVTVRAARDVVSALAREMGVSPSELPKALGLGA